MTSQRYREKTEDPRYTDMIILYNGEPHVTIPQLSYTKQQTMTDTVTPGFHHRIASGEVINNALVFYSESMYHSDHTNMMKFIEVQSPYGEYVYSTGNTTRKMLEVSTPPIVNPVAPLSTYSLENVAKQKAIAKIDATPHAFAEDLGEIRETIQFLRHPIQGIQRLVKTFEKHKKSLDGIRNVWERSQAIADLWNTYRFAAAPLVRSIVEAFNSLDEAIPTPPKRQRASGRAKASELSQSPTVDTRFLINHGRKFTYEREGYREINYHATVLYEVSNPIYDWKWRYGLRLKDIPTTTWELLPYSFMVDRLIDIKSFVAGLLNLADPDISILAGSLTVRDLSQFTVSLVDYEDLRYTVVNGKPDWEQYENYSQNRVLWTPGVGDTIPWITPKGLVKDLTSILDLVALTTSALPKANPAWG